MKKSKSVLDNIIEIIRDQPNKQVNLKTLYHIVPQKMRKEVSKTLIRGSITRRTIGVKTMPYKILFKRVAPSTYELIEPPK